jgi:fucose permease
MFFFAGLLGGRGLAAAMLKLRRARGYRRNSTRRRWIIHHRAFRQYFSAALSGGLGLSSLYPIYIAWLSKWFGARARKVGGLMFALAAAGASTMPTLVGVVSRYSQSLRIGMMVPLIGCAAMLAVIGLLRPNTRG